MSKANLSLGLEMDITPDSPLRFLSFIHEWIFSNVHPFWLGEKCGKSVSSAWTNCQTFFAPPNLFLALKSFSLHS